jgi:hypothetical protein
MEVARTESIAATPPPNRKPSPKELSETGPKARNNDRTEHRREGEWRDQQAVGSVAQAHFAIESKCPPNAVSPDALRNLMSTRLRSGPYFSLRLQSLCKSFSSLLTENDPPIEMASGTSRDNANGSFNLQFGQSGAVLSPRSFRTRLQS